MTPLKNYLDSLESSTQEYSLSWGLLSVAKGVAFINNDCHLYCLNLSLSSIFINDSCDWKLGNFDATCSSSESYPSRVHSHFQKYCPPEVSESSRSLNKWVSWICIQISFIVIVSYRNVDSWSLGCFIWEIYNQRFLQDRNSLTNTSRISKKLLTQYQGLISKNPRARLSLADFLEKGRASGGYFKNTFVDYMEILQEIQIKDAPEKNRFFSNLNQQVASFPHDVCKHKIHPLVVTSLNYGDANANILEILFKVCSKSMKSSSFNCFF